MTKPLLTDCLDQPALARRRLLQATGSGLLLAAAGCATSPEPKPLLPRPYSRQAFAAPRISEASCSGVLPAATSPWAKGKEILPSGRTGKVRFCSGVWKKAISSSSPGAMR